MRQGWPAAKSEVPVQLRPCHDLQAVLSIVFGGRCLLRGCRVIIPPPLRSTLMELAHEGHPGIARMKAKCREAIWWPGIDADVERFVRDCVPCVVSGKSVRPSPGALYIRFRCRRDRGGSYRWISPASFSQLHVRTGTCWWPSTTSASGRKREPSSM